MESIDRKRFRRLTFREFLRDLMYGFITEYETPKIVTIHSYTMTGLLRFMQTILLLYSIVYLFLYEKGYQKQDTAVISSITLKVKGIGYIQTSRNESTVIDGADFIVPPSENNAMFIMTNFIETDQSRSQCAESYSLTEATCRTDLDCQKKNYIPNANGRWTGRCLLPEYEEDSRLNDTNTTGLCQIEGWCPVEDDLQKPTYIKEIRNFTIFIKNFIEFPMFHVKHKNLVENLRPCVFDPETNKDCPIFRLDYIINEAEKNATERELMLQYGAVIRIKLDWDCNLDRRINICKPQYSFARLDTPFKEETFSLGFNFRFAYHWKFNETQSRSLTKAYGLRLIVSVSGKAGKFDFITLTLNTGSLVGIFGLATFFCDIILLHLSRKASIYRDFVFQRVHATPSIRSISQNFSDRQRNFSSTIFINAHALSRDLQVPLASMETLELTERNSVRFCLEPNESIEYVQIEPSLGLTNPFK